jgi:Tfp pilus assembly protein PilF
VKKSLFQKTFIHLIFIVILGFIAYSNTFHIPFHFDDKRAIAENPIIKDFQYFTSPSKAKVFTDHLGYHTFRSRYIGYLTFALNYSIHGLDTTGYHIVNLLIHVCTALLLYLLVHLTFQTPFLLTSGLRGYARQIALVAALLFACHPVQTEAVTYIWQRVASLTTMLYLLSLVLYIKWRLKGTSTDSVSENFMSIKSIALYLTSVVSAILAMKTKQTAFTLPIIVALYEFMFFREKVEKRIVYLLPLFLTMPIIPLTLIDIGKPWGDLIGDVSGATRDLTQMSRLDYLFTQFRVIVTYLRLIVLPIKQNFNYDYPVFHSFFTTDVFLSFLLLLTIFCSGIYLMNKSRFSSPHMRIIAFGIFWFFINLSVESSFIPIKEIIFEYRVYLPSVGIFLGTSTVVFFTIQQLSERSKKATKAVAALLVVLIILLTGATYARNAVWRDEITMWEDVVKKSPNKARGHNNLGLAYKSKGLLEKAIEQYSIAIKLDNTFPYAYLNLGMAYHSVGLLDKAKGYYLQVIKIHSSHYKTYNNLGNIFLSQGLFDKAIRNYEIAIKIKPDYALGYYNLGLAYQSKGMIEKANKHFKIAQRLNPDLFDEKKNQH